MVQISEENAKRIILHLDSVRARYQHVFDTTTGLQRADAQYSWYEVTNLIHMLSDAIIGIHDPNCPHECCS